MNISFRLESISFREISSFLACTCFACAKKPQSENESTCGLPTMCIDTCTHVHMYTYTHTYTRYGLSTSVSYDTPIDRTRDATSFEGPSSNFYSLIAMRTKPCATLSLRTAYTYIYVLGFSNCLPNICQTFVQKFSAAIDASTSVLQIFI